MDTERLIEDLRRPEAWPEPPGDVEVLQTHISVLFFGGERVYKVKKSVDLGFLDFSTLKKRRHFCQEEVRLNRRLAEGVHLGVVPITEAADGRLRLKGDGAAVEWAVEMIRLPADSMLDQLLEKGRIDNAQMQVLASVLARFHARVPTGEGVDEHGRPEAVTRTTKDNFEQTRPFLTAGAPGPPASRTAGKPEGRGRRHPSPAILSGRLHDFVEDVTGRFLATQRDLLERRVAEGRIREGHGDLHAGNICFTRDRIVIYDCIEFSRRLRCCDVAADLAFLLMDLDRRGFAGFSRFLARRYSEKSGDPDLEDLLLFYKTYRAMVRVKVACLTAADPDVTDAAQEHAVGAARRYLNLAAGYHLPPALVLMCGLPGAGKSWLARRLATPLNAVVLHSDVQRKMLAGVPLTERRTDDRRLYSAEMSRRTYETLRARADEALAAGRSVVIDATFQKAAHRRPFRETATTAGRRCVVVHVVAPEETVRKRMERRAEDSEAVSDADLGVYLQARREFEPPRELAPRDRLEFASGETAPENAVAALLERLVPDPTA